MSCHVFTVVFYVDPSISALPTSNTYNGLNINCFLKKSKTHQGYALFFYGIIRDSSFLPTC